MKSKDIDLDIVTGLASKGYTVIMIANAMNISKSYIYKHKDVIHAIKRGKAEASERIVDNLMARSADLEQSATASIFLAKQLKIYEDYFPTSKPKNIKQALEKIADIYTAYAHNELEEGKANKLIHFLEQYIRGYEASDLEARIVKIEERDNASK